MHEQHDAKFANGLYQVAFEAIVEHDGRVVYERANVQLVRVHVGTDKSRKVELAKRGTDTSDTSLQRLAHRAESLFRDEWQKREVEALNAHLINRTLAQAANIRAVDLHLFNRNASEQLNFSIGVHRN